MLRQSHSTFPTSTSSPPPSPIPYGCPSLFIMFAAPLLRNAASSSSSVATASSFSQAHRSYVKSLYRRYLKNSLDWCIRRDVWRDRAIEIRVEFERNRNIRNPRELANLFEKAERDLKRIQHPDPHRRRFFFSSPRCRSRIWRFNTDPLQNSGFLICSCNVRGRHKVGAQPATSHVHRGREEGRSRRSTPLKHFDPFLSAAPYTYIHPHVLSESKALNTDPFNPEESSRQLAL